MKIYYASINDMLDSKMPMYLELLPLQMQNYIQRFVTNEDKKHRILARLILRYCLILTTGSDALLYEWEIEINKKPIIKKWFEFSIAHSGEFVIFGYHDSHIGVDIEKMADLEYLSIVNYLHIEEGKLIEESKCKIVDFYNIWVKKEAALKAIGTGIINGMQEFSCVNDFVSYSNRLWIFYPIKISTAYICYACAQKTTAFEVKEFTLSQVDFITN